MVKLNRHKNLYFLKVSHFSVRSLDYFEKDYEIRELRYSLQEVTKLYLIKRKLLVQTSIPSLQKKLSFLAFFNLSFIINVKVFKF
jgi:hypothetical protein